MYRALLDTTTQLSDTIVTVDGLRPLIRIVSLCVTCIILPLNAAASTIDPDSTIGTVSDAPSGAFANGSMEGWTERSFVGNTRYEMVTEADTPVLKGHTQEMASILYREEDVDLLETPVVNWSWKVDRVFSDTNEQTKDGDDFPARLYVVAQTGFLPWETMAINYVWSSHLPIGEFWANPYTDKAKMIVMDSGELNVGRWVAHSRNVAEDFMTLFDTEIDEINGFAVMVDGDNSKQESVAWFGEISFSSEIMKSGASTESESLSSTGS